MLCDADEALGIGITAAAAGCRWNQLGGRQITGIKNYDGSNS